MVVDIGGGTCDVAVISLGGIVRSNSIKVAGNIDQAIIKHITNKYKILLGEKLLKMLKWSLQMYSIQLAREKQVVKGRNLLKGLPEKLNYLISIYMRQ